MPRPDPLPSPRRSLLRRFWRVFRWLVLFSTAVAVIAALAVGYGAPTDINLLVATGLGAGLTALLGSSLMTLMFLSSSSGYDEQVGDIEEEDE